MIKGWMKHDLYAKRDVLYSAAELAQLRAYYQTLTEKYLPPKLAW